jgi:hypothetical protein
MSTNPIVKTFKIFKDGLSSFLPSEQTRAIHTLAFEGTEKAFHGRMIVTVSHPTHAGDNASFPQLALLSLAGVRAALIGVPKHLRRRIATLQGHRECLADQVLIVVLAHRPPDAASVKTDPRRRRRRAILRWSTQRWYRSPTSCLVTRR